MAAMASMTLKSPTFLTSRGTQSRFNRVPLKSRRVKCMAEMDSKQQEASPPTDSSSTSTPPPPPTPTPIATSARPKRVSTKFGDVFAFSGPAPETINGRLAIVGFVSAVGVELASGQDLMTQLSNGGVLWFVITAGLLSAASLVPMFKGVSAESKSQSLFSSSAEMLNGRMAMIGLVALAVTEYVRGGPPV